MEQMLFEYALNFTILLVITLLSMGIKYLSKAIVGTPYEQISKKVIALVLIAEKQFIESGAGEAKKAYVLEKAAEFCKAKKIPIDAAGLEVILENAVSLINILRTKV